MKKVNTKLSYIVEIPKIKDEGYLCFAEEKNHIPFDIKRLYFIHDAENNAVRGKHAHKKNLQVLFCIKGSIKILLDNGQDKEEIVLNNSNEGIFLDKLMWHEMLDFRKETILLIIASEKYDENDYIRNYQEFLKLSQVDQSYQLIESLRNRIKSINAKIMNLIDRRNIQLREIK